MILAADKYRTNADLIVACHDLGYLHSQWTTLDPTWGRGTFWKKWQPDALVVNKDEHDFRKLPYADATFDAIAYDPPYVAKGGRSTSGIKEMDSRYGQVDCPATPELLQDLIDDGLTEMRRLIKPRGIVLVKCKDYVSSGKLWLGTHWTLTHALRLGFECVDRLEHIGNPGPQPPGRRQVHARRNLSTLFIFRAPGEGR